jgi:hypothetical protein
MVQNKIGNKQLRSFGLIVAAGFAVIALWPAIFRSQTVRAWPLAISVLLSAGALICPALLRPFHYVWMKLGETLGWVNSRILLTVLFYLVVVPIGAIRRMAGKDSMQRKLQPSLTTYKVPRAPRPASHMLRQY